MWKKLKEVVKPATDKKKRSDDDFFSLDKEPKGSGGHQDEGVVEELKEIKGEKEEAEKEVESIFKGIEMTEIRAYKGRGGYDPKTQKAAEPFAQLAFPDLLSQQQDRAKKILSVLNEQGAFAHKQPEVWISRSSHQPGYVEGTIFCRVHKDDYDKVRAFLGDEKMIIPAWEDLKEPVLPKQESSKPSGPGHK